MEAARLARGPQCFGGDSGGDIFRGVEPAERLANDFFGSVALQAHTARIPADDPAFQIKHVDGVIDDSIDKKLEAAGIAEREIVYWFRHRLFRHSDA